MTKQKPPDETNDFRQKAEKLIAEKGGKVSSTSADGDAQKLSHELSVYEIELQMQNEELRRSREQLE